MILLSARKLNFSVQYDDDKWNPVRASAWAQKSLLISSSSFASSGWNSSPSPWHSPLRFSPHGGFPSQSGFWWIRSLFLIILLNHLPQEISILRLFGLSRLLSHSVFWDMFLMHVTFPILQSQQSEYHLPKFSSRTKHVREGFPKSSFILRFPVCQEVLVISLIATAFHRIWPPFIIQSGLH